MTQPASGLVRLTDGSSNTVDFDIPVAGYSVGVDMPFEITELDDGSFAVYDYGSTYDKRWCDFTVELTAAQTSALCTFISTTARGEDYALEGAGDSNFCPFGPDKGPVGPFDCAVKIVQQYGLGPEPFMYFRTQLRAWFTGTSYPKYSMPAQTTDGPLGIGTLTGLRAPTDWFTPEAVYRRGITILEGRDSEYIDRGSGGDYYRTSAQLSLSEGNAAAVLDHLSETARANTLDLVVGANQYPFGRDRGDDTTFTVRWIQTRTMWTHMGYNNWQTILEFAYVS